VATEHDKFPAVTAMNGKLYVVGGQTELSSSPLAYGAVYDPANGEWSGLPQLKVARYSATAVGINGRLYVIGGYNGGDPLTAMEAYNPATNTWGTVTGMPTARWSPGAGAINGKIYVAGGEGDATLTTNQVYTP